MFETAELGQSVPKKAFEEQVLRLRQALLEAQGELRKRPFPVIVLFAGVDKAGKGETANLLSEWMDPRWVTTQAFDTPSDEERERPEYWRYWRALPPKGHVGIYLSAWYSRPLLDRVYDRIDANEFEQDLDRIADFEQLLAKDGALVIKFWMHLGRDAQARRLRELEADPLLAWRVTESDWQHFEQYDRFVPVAERIITRTSTGQAPWHIVEGEDHNFRSLRVGALLLEAIQRRLAEVPCPKAAEGEEPEPPVKLKPRTVLSNLDMKLSIEKSEYRRELELLQGRLHRLQRRAQDVGRSMVLVFEGWDAGGKGGAIRRITSALDARRYRIIPIAAPTDEERAQHYLWRFWRHLARDGRVTIFDRSWYGRVLVERVEGFATETEWRRAYAEINQFERALHEHGTVVVKFWLHITKKEQAERFKLRSETPHKQWKLTDEDWRNRSKWAEYELATHDMVERTSTTTAPWILVEGNDKRYARVKVLRTVCEALERALQWTPPAPVASGPEIVAKQTPVEHTPVEHTPAEPDA